MSTMPRWDSQLIELVRERNDIVDVISQYIPLKRAGSNYKALSPFKKEKTPSFYVTPSKQIWYCFSTGQGGDVFKFLQTYLGLDFPSAVRMLAQRAGVELHENETDQQHSDPGGNEIKDQLLDLHEKISAHWHRLLLRSPDASHARDYLTSRGVKIETAREFRLGFAPPGWDNTLNWALSEGYSPQILEAAGLIVRRQERLQDLGYDRFRNRIIIPITSESGQVIGFSGRTLEAGDTREAKYINSPETAIFEKNKILFGLEMHRRDILASRQAIVVEGPFDLIACHMAGIRNVVAPQGTALTERQVRIIKRYADEVILCYDADEAGRLATTRAAVQCLAAGLPVRVLSLASEDGSKQDPDSYLRKHGPEAMQKLISTCPDFWFHHISEVARSNPTETERGRYALKRAVFEPAALIQEASTLDRVLQLLAARLNSDPRVLAAEFSDWKKKNPGAVRAFREENPLPDSQPITPFSQPSNEKPTQAVAPLPHSPHPVIKEILQHIINSAETNIPLILAEIDPDAFSDLSGQEILSNLLKSYALDTWEGLEKYIQQAKPEEQSFLYRLLSQEVELPPIQHTLVHLRRIQLEKELRRIENCLRNAKPEDAKILLTQLLDIKSKIDNLQLPAVQS